MVKWKWLKNENGIEIRYCKPKDYLVKVVLGDKDKKHIVFNTQHRKLSIAIGIATAKIEEIKKLVNERNNKNP